MPTIIIGEYKFRFYSFDIQEPPHVHVIRGDDVVKIWLQSLDVEYNHGYNKPELNKILRLTRENKERLLETWNDYFSQ